MKTFPNQTDRAMKPRDVTTRTAKETGDRKHEPVKPAMPKKPADRK